MKVAGKDCSSEVSARELLGTEYKVYSSQLSGSRSYFMTALQRRSYIELSYMNIIEL